MAKQRSNPKQAAFLAFLKRMEQTGAEFSMEDIAANTGYPLKGTVKAKMSRNEWDAVLERRTNGKFKAKGVKGLSLEQFAQRLSTKKGGQSLVASPYLSQSYRLLKQAKDNFVLSLELYNRPSLENRFQAFTMLHCAAWEHMLKGILSNSAGEDSIFTSKATGHTKGLEQCAAEVLGPGSKQYQNLKKLIDLRNMSTHLLLPELGGAYGPIFQAAVINFLNTWKANTTMELLPASEVGMLTLVTGIGKPTSISLEQKYGPQLSKVLSAHIAGVDEEILNNERSEFAIELKHSVVFGKKGESHFTIEELLDGKERIKIEKVISDHEDELLPKMVIDKVNDIIKTAISEADRKEIFSYSGKGQVLMNRNDWDAICADQKWKKGKNKFHRSHGPINQGTFTVECIHWIVDMFKKDKGYLARVKKKYVQARKRK
ncbi:MAG: DUF3644 domain-containing protein [Flavobacteriales bacterium]|nr:DUF3644 domain-containing protein [Flavobacteriales bacterium]